MEEKKKQSVFDRDPLGYYNMVSDDQISPLSGYIERRGNAAVRKGILRKIERGKSAGIGRHIASRSAVIGALGAGAGLGAYKLLNSTKFVKNNSLKGKLIAGGIGATIGGLAGAYAGNRYDKNLREYADEPEEFLRRDEELKRLNEKYRKIGKRINSYA